MSAFWYYAAGQKTRGPTTFDELINLLSVMPSPREVLVWREGMDQWTAAENVREIAAKLIRPPPLPDPSVIARNEGKFPVGTLTPKKGAVAEQQEPETIGIYQQRSGELKPEVFPGRTASTRGRLAFFIVFVIVVSVGAYFTTQIYNNSADGIAYFAGQLFGTWFLLTLLTWWLRKSPYTAAIVLAVSALSVGGVNFAKLQDAISVREAKGALQGVADPNNIGAALSKNPSNKLLQFMAMVNKAAQDTDAAVTKLSNEIEPPSLTKDIDLTIANRKDLEGLRSDAKTAEDNVAAFMLRYLALQKAERDKVEGFATSIHMDSDTIREGLVGIDRRHAKAATFSVKMTQARTEFYRAYENYLSFLLGEYGTYNVLNGQISFPRQPTADRYNVVSSALSATSKGVTDLEVQRKALIQAQQEEWERFVKDR